MKPWNTSNPAPTPPHPLPLLNPPLNPPTPPPTPYQLPGEARSRGIPPILRLHPRPLHQLHRNRRELPSTTARQPSHFGDGGGADDRPGVQGVCDIAQSDPCHGR